MQSQNNVINPVAKQSLVERITIETKGHDGLNGSSDSSLDDRAHGAPQVIGEEPGTSVSDGPAGKRMFAFLKSRNFWIVLALSQTITLCQTGTNTFSGLLAAQGTSIPAFQSFFTYVLLNLVYTPYTIYRYGFKKWLELVLKDGWRYTILAFLDVEGNYMI